MSSKRCHDDLHTHGSEDDQRPLRPRYDFQNNTQQLHEIINNHLQMLPPNPLNMIDRLHELIDEQHEWLGAAVDSDVQIGAGTPNNDPSGYDPTAPDMGLSQHYIDRLVREGGSVGDFTIVPRPRFNGLEIRRTLNFREIATDDFAAYNIFLHDILNEIVTLSRLLAGDGVFFNISLQGASLPTDINAVLTPDNNHDVNVFVDQIERTVQSNTDVAFDTALELRVSVARNKQGGVGARRKLSDLAHNQVIQKNRMHLFAPKNVTDNMCFSMCIAHFLNPQCTDAELMTLARNIHTDLGYDPQDKIALHDVSKFEAFLDLKIVIFHRSGSGKLEVYKNTDEPHHKTLHLYLHEEHFYGIKNLKGFLGYGYVCEYCYRGFNDRSLHYCKFTCNVCMNTSCYTHPKKSVQCDDCLRYCRSDLCYEMHKQTQSDGSKSQCDSIKYCDKCCRQYRTKWSGDKLLTHKCAPSRCVHCAEVLMGEEQHCCYIQPSKPREHSQDYIYFDFETMYEDGRHKANYVCALTQAGDEFSAEGVDCVDQMVKHFRRPKFEGFTFIAHNSSGFDSFILLEYFTSQGLTPKIILQGCRLVYMYDQVFKQRYIDSYSFLPMKLSKMTSALNLNTSEKGYFPHHFNRLQNANYIGPYPSKDYYGYQTMSDAERVKFDSWYEGVAGGVFDFKKQLALYCKNDVVLLREGCMKYRKEFIECTNVDPFGCITLAGCAMKVFKTLFLTKDTIALTHKNAYINQYKAYSNPSIQWLEYIKASRNVDVHHALNYGEAKFEPYHVDGYYEADNGDKIALEFLGCFWHGHCCCFNPNDLNPVSKTPFGLLRRQSDNKLNVLRNTYNLKVHKIWECQWESAKQNDPNVIAFMSNYNAPARLNPRQALYGGRTNALRLYHETAEGERVSYLDFTSLYPYVQSCKTYPIGHPEIILKDFEPVKSYFGLIKCSVLPPRKLLHPILPAKSSQGKLLFALCRTCAETQYQGQCQHSDDERIISGVWTSVELSRAIDKGYSVVRIDEVWHFPQTSDTLFSGYVKTFLKFKQEASGFPSHVVTDDEKESYVRDYFEKEGVHLDLDKIALNPARRSINKYLLNSLWGRFGLRCNQATAELLTDPEDFARYIFGNGRVIKHFSFVSDTVALVQWCYADEDPAPASDVNVFIAAFTTAYGRLELYDLMDQLGPRVFYVDTDSVIFVSKDGDWMPKTGAYLGELTDELDDGDFITTFASMGPKSYSFKTTKNKVTLKAKGVTLHSANAKIVTLESMIGLIQGYVTSRDTSHLLTRTETIVRNKKKFTLHNTAVLKRFKVVYDKRVLLPDYTTLPYGY
ncbi:uncharacterized protein LOC127968976 [Carassius gibelio]|uniref:uncharacterized protein LOC127968976 n=1 Tax=Carassius gibelio TaxID=101364 RepID=UPI0022779E2F|nr:uncharacterized protein LOC127968976 [Carassius gibelio]